MFNFRTKSNELNDGLSKSFIYPPFVFELLDTPEMQRLYSIIQNGFSGYAFPNLTHTRKAHSIGTAKNAIRMWRRASIAGPVKFEEAQIGMYEGYIVAAALLHDLGHSPYSHDLESLITHFSGKNHEQVAAEIITGELSLQQFYAGLPSGILTEGHRKAKLDVFGRMPKIPDILRHYGLDAKIVASIVDTSRDPSALSINHFLQEFVNHPVVDADKLDYLVRDPHNSGMTDSLFNPDGLIDNLGIVRMPDGLHLAIRDTGIETVNQLLTTRSHMYQNVFLHKTVLKVQAMAYDALKRFLAALGEDATKFGSSLYLLDDDEFEAFVSSNSDRDPIAARLYMTAKYNRREKYSFAYQIESKDIPNLGDPGNETRALLERLLEVEGRFPEDGIRDEILARVNAGNGPKLQDHEIVVYFPQHRKLPTCEDMLKKFRLHVFEHRDESKVYVAGEKLRDGFDDERLENTFRTFCRHQTSNYFIVLTPLAHVPRVRESTEHYMRELMQAA